MNRCNNVLIVEDDKNVESFIKANKITANKAELFENGDSTDCYVILPKDSKEVDILKSIMLFKFNHDYLYEQDSNGGFYKVNSFGGITELDKLRYKDDLNLEYINLSYIKLNDNIYQIRRK